MTDWLVARFIRDSGNVRDSAVRGRYGFLSGAVGIFLNLLLCLGKLLAGYLTGSVSVTADAFNNLSDAALRRSHWPAFAWRAWALTRVIPSVTGG